MKLPPKNSRPVDTSASKEVRALSWHVTPDPDGSTFDRTNPQRLQHPSPPPKGVLRRLPPPRRPPPNPLLVRRARPGRPQQQLQRRPPSPRLLLNQHLNHLNLQLHRKQRRWFHPGRPWRARRLHCQRRLSRQPSGGPRRRYRDIRIHIRLGKHFTSAGHHWYKCFCQSQGSCREEINVSKEDHF